MKLLRLIKKETDQKGKEILIYAGVSGIASAVILAIINIAAQAAPDDGISFRFLLMFIVAFLVFFMGMKVTFDKSRALFEEVISNLRTRIYQKIRQADLLALHRIGQEEIYNRLTQEMTVISETQRALIVGFQSMVLVVFIVFYMAILSGAAFVITLIMIAGGLIIYFSKQKEVIRFLNLTVEKEIELFGMVAQLLGGFKQVKIHGPKGDELMEDLEKDTHAVRDLKIKTARLMDSQHIFSQSFFYFLLGVLVFLLPRLRPTGASTLDGLIAAVLFLIGPLTMVIVAIPAYAKAEQAIEHIHSLEEKLDKGKRKGEGPHHASGDSSHAEFKTIAFQDIYFSYRVQGQGPGFRVGPFDFEVNAGETLFVIGGNGSGKSTLIHILTGLVTPDMGVIRVDQHNLTPADMGDYRQLFSVVLSDFHLFKKLYGLKNLDPQTAAHFLKAMEIDKKTSVAEDRFTNLDLSTGQRKRLALVVALLEDRPVYVFDEWTADQDPQFREHFYRTLVPDLNKQGKTVIAATHDDRYFETADRILEMEDGRIKRIRRTGKAPNPER